MHCVFSTRGRRPVIAPEIARRLWPYLGGVARANDMRALVVGGAVDHVHLLVSIPSTITIAKALQLLKGNSSNWVNKTYPSLGKFAWQEGYGAFSVSVSQVDKTVAYINSQEKHHRRKTFEEEFLAFLKRHGIPYDERYVFG